MTLLTAVLVFAFLLLFTYRPSAPGTPRWSQLRVPVRLRARSRSVRRGECAWIDALIGELTVGRDPVAALVTACESQTPVVAYEAFVAARTGGEVAQALTAHDSELVRSVGACWLVASTSGAGLVAALASIAESAREQERIQQGIDIAIAEPRAAAAVVAALPIVGLGMGSLLGASPLGWLLGTGVGRVILLAATALELMGCWWSRRIIRAVADPS